MNSQTIVYCVVALILGMLMANMLKSVCGCNKVVEGTSIGTSTLYLSDTLQSDDPIDNAVAGRACMTLDKLEESGGCGNPWDSTDWGHCTCPPGKIKVSESKWFPVSGQGSCNICVEGSDLPLTSSKPLSTTGDGLGEGNTDAGTNIYTFDKVPCFSLFTKENCEGDSRCMWWGDQIDYDKVGHDGGLLTVDGMRKCTMKPDASCDPTKTSCDFAFQTPRNYDALFFYCTDYILHPWKTDPRFKHGESSGIPCSHDSFLVPGFTGFNGKVDYPQK
jgi:hypothetical protein